MAPNAQNLFSPAELAFLHSSLSLSPPVRPDARSATQFRPLVAEGNILPGTNGSARICFADGTEAVVGIKAEVEPTQGAKREASQQSNLQMTAKSQNAVDKRGSNKWIEMRIEIPGHRDDDPLPVYLSSMLLESFVAGGDLTERLFISPSWHWKLYIDILLLSPPFSYPVPLLSLTTHLALLSCRLPALKSQQDEDPFFDDDWEASTFVYPPSEAARPSVTLLVASVGSNILFDPSSEEIAVAETLLAVSLSRVPSGSQNKGHLRLLSVRTVDSPARLTSAGAPDGGAGSDAEQGLWKPRRGGMTRSLVPAVTEACLVAGGIGDEILTALQAVDTG